MGSSVWPSSSALRTWRCSRNQSNQAGNSVNTSMFIGWDSLSEEVIVDVDLALLDRPDGVGHERDEHAVLELEHRTGGAVDHGDPPAVARDRAADKIGGEPLALLQLHVDEQRLPARRA